MQERAAVVVADAGFQPEVAVVTPAYNSESFLEAAVRSVLAQNHQGIEHIVVDDGSTDGTAEVANRLAEHLPSVRFIQQSNSGVSAARNLGYAHISPSVKYVLFLDADDVLRPHAIRTLLGVLQRTPAAVAAHGQSDRIDAAGTVMNDIGWERRDGRLAPAVPLRRWFSRSVRRLGDAEPTSFGCLLLRNPVTTPGQVLVRRSALADTMLFDRGFVGVEDWHMLIQLARLGEIAYIPAVVLSYRRHDAGASLQLSRMRQAELRMRRRLIADESLTPEQQLLARIGHRRAESDRVVNRLQMARQSASSGQWRSAIRDVVRAGSSASYVAQSWLPTFVARKIPLRSRRAETGATDAQANSSSYTSISSST